MKYKFTYRLVNALLYHLLYSIQIYEFIDADYAEDICLINCHRYI